MIKTKPTYQNLFDTLEKRLWLDGCDDTLRCTEAFASRHALAFPALRRTLREMGAYCDCEVLLNAADSIPPEEVIGEETFTTPVKYAEERGWYFQRRVGGLPVSFAEAVAAQEAGLAVEWSIPCGPNDAHAQPDLNRAIQALHEQGKI